MTGRGQAASTGASASIVLRGPISALQARELFAGAERMLTAGVELLVCELQGTTDLSVVDMLARLRLLTRRRAAQGLRMQAIDQDVDAILAFAGLEDIFDRDC